MALNPLTWLCLALVWEQLSCHLLLPNAEDGGAGHPVSSGTAPHLQADERKMAARALLDSIAGGFPTAELSLARGRLSCGDLALTRDLLDNLQLSRDLVATALALALGGLGCRAEAEPHILQLYEDLGVEEANEMFLQILAYTSERSHLSVAASSNGEPVKVTGPALLFNMDQIADTFRGSRPEASRYRCAELVRVNGSLLVGPVHSAHASFAEASSTCRRLGRSCAGVAPSSASLFQVLGREGSYFLPCPTARSWLHHCKGAHHFLQRRSTPAHCQDQKEQDAHSIIQWLPLVSTYYSLGTAVYYSVHDCSELAEERALEAVVDLGYDAVVAMTGTASGLVGLGVAAGLKPGLKAGVRAVVDYFRRTNTAEQ